MDIATGAASPETAAEQVVRAVFRKHGGVLRMADALRAGVHRRTLYAMRVPHAVVYLISALAFHELTTQIPHEVWLGVPRNSEPPRLDYPPIRVVRLSPGPYGAGIETHELDGVRVKVYCREKTIADCFKHRTEIGLDTALEAVRMYKAQGRVDADALLRYAAVCRVARVARPYLEALL